jgi:hypothetical protein
MRLRTFLLILTLGLLFTACFFYLRMPPDQTSTDPDTPQDGTAGGSCAAFGVSCASDYFAVWKWPENGSCVVGMRNGYPVPDARCTPGGVVPNLSLDMLRNPLWRTKCIRNCQSSESQKHITYEWYGLTRPNGNNGKNQVCELDHLVPLELGGADGLGNIWPQCGPDEDASRDRYFKTERSRRRIPGRKGASRRDAARRGATRYRDRLDTIPLGVSELSKQPPVHKGTLSIPFGFKTTSEASALWGSGHPYASNHTRSLLCGHETEQTSTSPHSAAPTLQQL